MKVYRPIQSNYKTQGFGENKACAKTNIHGVAITPYKVLGTRTGICPVDYKPFYKLLGLKGHNGEDWATWHAEPFYFPVEADTEWIVRNEIDYSGGKGIDVFSEKPILDGKRVKFRFWHLKDSVVADKFDGVETIENWFYIFHVCFMFFAITL